MALVQALLVIGTTALLVAMRGRGVLLPALYGGGVAMLNTWWLGSRVEKAAELAVDNPQRGMYTLYFNAVQRFVFVLAALGVGLAALHLEPVSLLLTFGVAQLAYVLGNRLT